MGEETPFREQIAKVISVSVIISTGVLGALAVLLGITYILKDSGTDGKGLEKAQSLLQYIFASLLPLWGTWIGTVLAYYFAKENFESANKQVRELVNQVKSVNEKLNSLPVTEVMMPIARIKLVSVASNADADKLNVQKVYNDLVTNGIRRALIFNGQKIVYVLHKGLLADYLLRHQSPPAAANPAKPPANPLTIGDMKTDPDKDIRNVFVNGAGIVSKRSTLLDVKVLMDNLAGCQDVFVTENGKKDEDVLGWISNVDLLEKTKV